jgi:hypothetical protein
MQASNKVISMERRSKVRYPLRTPVSYRTLDGLALTGEGEAVDMSSAGVADSLNNRIAAIPNAISRQSSAGTGTTVTTGGTLNDPLGLAVGHHDIATVNGDDGFLVITRPDGTQVFTKLLDSTGTPPGSGALFGLAFAPEGLFFVDDATNTLNVLR